MCDISNSFNDKAFIIASTITSNHSPAVPPEKLTKQWGIGLEAAKQTPQGCNTERCKKYNIPN